MVCEAQERLGAIEDFGKGEGEAFGKNPAGFTLDEEILISVVAVAVCSCCSCCAPMIVVQERYSCTASQLPNTDGQSPGP